MRRKAPTLKNISFGDLFENWQCLLHYYYLHCILNRMKANSLSWIHFLKSTYKKSYLSSAVMDHIKIANSLSDVLGVPGPAVFKEKVMNFIFLGKGLWSGAVSECLFFENLDADIVYSNKRGQIIFTQDSRVLSHGFLAAAETLSKVVGNIDPETWSSLQSAARVTIDFENGFLKNE